MHSRLAQLILKEIGAQGWRYAAYMLVIALVACVSVLPPKLYAFYVSQVAAMQTMSALSAETFLKELMLFGGIVALVMFVGNGLRVLCEEWVCLRMEGSLRSRFMDYSQRLPLTRLEGAERGEWLTRMSGDIRSVENFMTSILPQQVQDFVIMLAVGVIFVWQDGRLAFFLLVSSAIIAVFNFIVQRRINPIIDRLRDMHGQVFQAMLENFEGMRTIRSFGIESYVLRKFNARVDAIIQKGMRAVRWVSLMVGSNALAIHLLTACTLSLVASMLREESLRVNDVFSYPFYIGMFYASVFALVRSVHEWNEFLVHGRRLAEMIAPLEEGGLAADGIPLILPADLRRLDLRGVSIGYAGEEALTRPFDFTMERGKIVLITGPSGCGKSTFLEALAGLRGFEVSEILASQGRGRLVSHERPSALVNLPLNLATLVEQRPFLFAGSLEDNVRLGASARETDDVWQALEEAHIAGLAAVRGGLGMSIRDGGSNLSEGQKQRISFARALLHRRPFILLDEPFASLDPHSVDQLCHSLNQLKDEHGMVVVSHVVPRKLLVDRFVSFDEFQAPLAGEPHLGVAPLRPTLSAIMQGPATLP